MTKTAPVERLLDGICTRQRRLAVGHLFLCFGKGNFLDPHRVMVARGSFHHCPSRGIAFSTPVRFSWGLSNDQKLHERVIWQDLRTEEREGFGNR